MKRRRIEDRQRPANQGAAPGRTHSQAASVSDDWKRKVAALQETQRLRIQKPVQATPHDSGTATQQEPELAPVNAVKSPVFARLLFFVSDTITKLFVASPLLYKLTAMVGMALFAAGFIAALMWNVPWMFGFKGGDVAVALLCIGGGILAMWFLSGINQSETT